MTKPLIGLTGRRKAAGDMAGTPPALHALEGDWFYADYARGVLEAGGLPVNIPLDGDVSEYLDRLDGLLLSGGADIDPAHYGHEAHAETETGGDNRDEFELAIATDALDRSLPTLGICRGIQILNVAGGGTLNQHVPEHAFFESAPDTLAHEISFAEGSTLSSIYGKTRQVNSLHHQTVDTLASGFQITAAGPDGGVEGMEHEDKPVVAVQWHPEMLPTRSQDPIFAWLVNAAIT